MAETAQSGSPSRMISNAGDTENHICKDGVAASDVPTLWKEEETISISTKMLVNNKKKKPGGFNLRKSLAWNPAFLTEQGVLDNLELSVLSGSHVNAIGSPASGIGSKMPPLYSIGKSGNRSVLEQVTENSRGKLLPKFQSTENKGRKLFPSAETSGRDERKRLVGAQSKSSTRSTLKSIPRSSTGYTQKKAPNPSSTAQMSKIPKYMAKKSQVSLPPVPRNTSFVTTISKTNKNLPPADNARTVEGLPPKSRMEPSPCAKSSGFAIQKDLEPPVTAIHEEANISGSCRAFSPYSQSSASSSVGVPASEFAKPSALRMPSPSVGFFAQGKGPASHGHTAQRNVERCFTGNPTSLTKPPRYKQPENLKSKLSLPKQQPANCSAISKLHAQPLTSESTLCNRTFLFPSVKHTDPSNAKESLSKDIITNSARSGNINCEEMPEADCLSVRIRDNAQPPSSEKIGGGRHGTLDVYDDASPAEGRSIIKDDELIEDSCSLKAVFSSTKPTVGSKLSSSCISPQACTHADLCHQRSEDGAAAAIILKNSLVRETAIANSLSEGDNCTPGPDFMLDLGSCHHQNTDRSTHLELVGSIVCADREPLGASLGDLKSDLANSRAELHDSLDEEVQPASSEEPNTGGRMEPSTKNSLVVKEAFMLHLGHNHDHGNTECSTPIEAEAPVMSSDLDARCAVLSGLQAATAGSKAELHESLAEENQPVLSEEPNTKKKMVLDTNSLSVQEGASHIENDKEMDKPIANTIPPDHLKHLVPFTEEWFAVMETCGEEILELKTGAVQNSPTDKTAPEPSPWSPVKRKAQDVGPFDCTKYSKSIRTSDTL